MADELAGQLGTMFALGKFMQNPELMSQLTRARPDLAGKGPAEILRFLDDPKNKGFDWRSAAMGGEQTGSSQPAGTQQWQPAPYRNPRVQDRNAMTFEDILSRLSGGPALETVQLPHVQQSTMADQIRAKRQGGGGGSMDLSGIMGMFGGGGGGTSMGATNFSGWQA